MTEAVEIITTTTETPREALARLRTELTRAEAELKSAKQTVGNLRNVHSHNISFYHRDSPENEAELERGEQRLLSCEIKVEDLRAEMRRIQAAGAEERARENAKRAIEAHEAKIVALSESQVPVAEAQLADAQDAFERAQADHAALTARVNALKTEATNQDARIKRNQEEYAAAIVAGTTPPVPIARIDFAPIVKQVGSGLDASEHRVDRARQAVHNAQSALTQAQTAEAYAVIYKALAPALEALPETMAHPDAWNGVLQVQRNSTAISLTIYLPGHA